MVVVVVAVVVASGAQASKSPLRMRMTWWFLRTMRLQLAEQSVVSTTKFFRCCVGWFLDFYMARALCQTRCRKLHWRTIQARPQTCPKNRILRGIHWMFLQIFDAAGRGIRP